MNQDETKARAPVVTQADRDAAADHLERVGAATAEAIKGTREGRYQFGLSEAFARHREAALSVPPVNEGEIERMAAAVHDARFPDGAEASNYIPYEEEDRHGQEYCRRIARAVLAIAPPPPLNGPVMAQVREALDGLNAHVEAMQGMCSRYLEPVIYVASNGMMAKAGEDAGFRDKLFISDMIYMLDGPEQREAQDRARVVLTAPPASKEEV